MSTAILRDQKLWYHGYDLTGQSNALALDYGADMLDDTVLGDDTRSYKAGLYNVTCQAEGFCDASTYDKALFDGIGVIDKPFSFGSSGTAGVVAYSFLSGLGNYKINGKVGELWGFSASAQATGKLIRGTLMINAASVASSSNGTGYQLGALSSTQTLYGALHVLSASGSSPTLDVTVQSDNANNFPSPATKLTFTQATGITSQVVTATGAITDDWFRVHYTLGGGSPVFSFVLILGIY